MIAPRSFREHLDAALATVRYGDSTSCREAAAAIQQAITRVNAQGDALRAQLADVQAVVSRLVVLRDNLLELARQTRQREDFGNDFATVNSGRIAGDIPNPEV